MNRYVAAFKKSQWTIRLPELRRHQLEGLDVLSDLDKGYFARTAPTGTGKTLEMVVLALWNVLVKKRQVIIVVPSLIILSQVVQAFRRFTSLNPGVDQAKTASVPGEAIVLCTAQTFWRRCSQPTGKGYIGKYLATATVLFDEVHGCNATDEMGEEENRNLQTILKFSDVKGFSASPFSPWCLAFLEQRALYLRSVAVREGHAASYTLVPLIPDETAQLGRTIWFHSSVAAAEEAHKRASSKRTGLITGPKPVQHVVSQFHAGSLDRVLAVGRGTVGFDTDAQSVVIDRDLQSPVLAVQMAGRLRPGPGRTVYCRPAALDALLEGQQLTDGKPVECRKCGASTHLTNHHRGP